VSDDGGVSDTDATRRFYDTVAAAYAAALPDTRAEAPLDLGMIAQFVADVPDGDGLIVDAGCGTGRLLAHLATLGASPLAGVDLSPAMVTRARDAQPDIPVEVAELTALPFPDATVRGILCWYAIIHSDADEVTAISREACHRGGGTRRPGSREACPGLRPGAPPLRARRLAAGGGGQTGSGSTRPVRSSTGRCARSLCDRRVQGRPFFWAMTVRPQ